MKDRLLTIVLSVATTLGLLKSGELCKCACETPKELDVDRLIVRKELIVSDTGAPWEAGYEAHQIPRGIYAKTLDTGVAGLWVRSRLIKGEIDDPFDDRFHAMERSGQFRTTPGHISWNIWLDGAWRQMAIIQGEGLENSEVPYATWNGGNHPGRIRFQSFRPGHSEPLTDAHIGQGKMSLGGGGFGGGGLPYASEVLELWGGNLKRHDVGTPSPPSVLEHDGSGSRSYAIIAIGPQGDRSTASKSITTSGLAKLQWDSVAGADSYALLRDGKEIAVVRVEGSQKIWQDTP